MKEGLTEMLLDDAVQELRRQDFDASLEHPEAIYVQVNGGKAVLVCGFANGPLEADLQTPDFERVLKTYRSPFRAGAALSPTNIAGWISHAVDMAEGRALGELVNELDAAVWKLVAEAFPQTSTGDMPPLDAVRFRNALLDAVAVWVTWNLPASNYKHEQQDSRAADR